MRDTFVFGGLAVLCGGIAWGFFRHPSWSEGNSVGVGIKWGAVVCAPLLAVATVASLIARVL